MNNDTHLSSPTEFIMDSESHMKFARGTLFEMTVSRRSNLSI